MRKRICNEDLDRSFGIPSSSFFKVKEKGEFLKNENLLGKKIESFGGGWGQQ